MRSLYLTVLIFLAIPLLAGAGCATLTQLLDSLDQSDKGSAFENDPVAEAAMNLRRPASTPVLDADDDSLWNRHSPPTADTISYGMEMGDVASIWGRPTHIDAAGASQEGNQRWTYYSGLSSRYGLGSRRTVYFENGRVVGWKR